MMRKISLSVLALLLTFCLVYGQTPTLAKADDSQVVRVWGSDTERENNVMREIASEYKELTGVTVEIIDRRSLFDAPKDLINNAATDERPDIVLMQHADIGDLAVSGFLQELHFSEETLNSFNPIAFDSFQIKNKQYGIGYSIETYGIIYNKDLITEAELPTTWSDFFTLSSTITNSGTGNLGTLINPTNMYFMYPIMKNYGGYYYGQKEDGQYNSFDVGLNNEGMLDYINAMKEAQSNGLLLSSRSGTDNDVSAAFINGNIAMIINGLWQASFYQQKGINYGIAPLPNYDDGTPSEGYATINGFVVNAFSRNMSGATGFLEFLCKDENQQRMVEAGNNYLKKTGIRFPSNISVRQSEYVTSDEKMSVLVQITKNIEPICNIPEGPIWYNYTEKAFQAIFYGDIYGNPVDAKSKLNELAKAILSDVQKMNVAIEAVEISWWVYAVMGGVAALVVLILILKYIRKRKNLSYYVFKNCRRITVISWLTMLPLIVLLGLFYVFPIIHNIYLSFTDYSALNLINYNFVGIYNYQEIFSEGLKGLLSMLVWTIIFAVSVVVITFLGGTFLASVLGKLKVSVSKIYKLIFLLPWVVPSVITLLMWNGILATDSGMLNQFLALLHFPKVPWLDNPWLARLSTIFVISWMGTPYFMVLALGFLKSIPKDFYEAAELEGANKILIFFKITIPLLIKAMLPTLIMGFIMQFNNFGVYLLTYGGPFGGDLGAPGATDLLITFVYNLAYNTKRYSLASAYSVFIFIFVAAFSLITMFISNRKFNEAK